MRKMFAQLHKKGGFTLVELIVVICVLAILAGIAVPAYSGYIREARKASDLVLLEAVNKAFAAACLEHGFTAADVKNVLILLTDQKVDSIRSVAIKVGAETYYLTQEEVAALQDAFEIFFGENADVAFEEAAYVLSWNEDKMVFQFDGWRETEAGNKTNSRIVANYLRSSFWSDGAQSGVEGVLSAVDGLAYLLGRASGGDHSTMPLYRLLGTLELQNFMMSQDSLHMAELEYTDLREEINPNSPNAAANQQSSVIAVLYVASQLNGMSAEQAIGRIDEGSFDPASPQGFVNEAANYAALLGFAYNNPEYIAETKLADGTTIPVKLYDHLTSGNVSGSYLQSWLDNSESGIMNTIEFENYRNSGQMQTDINAFLGVMQLINANQSTFKYTDVNSYRYFSSDDVKAPFLDVLGISGGN